MRTDDGETRPQRGHHGIRIRSSSGPLHRAAVVVEEKQRRRVLSTNPTADRSASRWQIDRNASESNEMDPWWNLWRGALLLVERRTVIIL
jgi:hypothetical protein